MDNKQNMCPLLSLCIPTNGVVEWVFPVLNSIYANDNTKNDLFEIVITDNGNNIEFENKIKEYKCSHPNIVYKKTTAEQFLNQIEAFRLANGVFIKFVNHRSVFEDRTLDQLLDFVKKNKEEKPGIFFSNGTLKNIGKSHVCNNFDEYICTMSYMSSWSGGTAIWKSDFENIGTSHEYNKLFPHTGIVFSDKDKRKYIVDNNKLFKAINTDESKKGTYNLFEAFAVVFPQILIELAEKKAITWETFHRVLYDLRLFIAHQYMEYVILKKPCSYDTTKFKCLTDVFFDYKVVMIIAHLKNIKRILRKYLFRF